MKTIGSDSGNTFDIRKVTRMEPKSNDRPDYNSAKALKDAGVAVKPLAEKVLNILDRCIWKADLARIKQEKSGQKFRKFWTD